MLIHYWNMNVDNDCAADTETDMESIWIAFGTGYREYCQFFHKLVKMSRLCMVMLCLFQPSLFELSKLCQIHTRKMYFICIRENRILEMYVCLQYKLCKYQSFLHALNENSGHF